MESTQKKISIHPDLMFMTSGKTQKKKSVSSKPTQIKVKSPPKAKNNTLRKQSLLKMIRKHQDEKHRQQLQMLSPNHTRPRQPVHNTSMNDTLQFMNNVKEKHVTNQTLKNNNYNSITISNDNQEPIRQDNTHSVSSHNIESANLDNQDNSIRFNVNVPQNNIQPKYGCLKDGNLPTYKSIQQHNNNSGTQKHLLRGPHDNGNNNNMNIRQRAELNALQKYTTTKQKYTSNKQRKLIRRTFNVGKHNNERKISVLISNKKIRSNTTLKLQQLKEIPIFQVKKDLISRGLIKVGCITPESVLRQMYIMTNSMCGSVYNHNADLLIHNYLNDE
tara:strand:+ start:2720 stop:3712 length:993 start_codon:yes stop_codon:yes gene_type:complete